MHSCVASSIVILNGDVVTDNPFHFKCSVFIRSFNRFFYSRFYLVYLVFVSLFVCQSNECSNEKYLDQNDGNIYSLLVFDKFVVHCGSAGGVWFIRSFHTRTFVHFSLLLLGIVVFVCCVCVFEPTSSTHSIDKRKTQTTFHRLN